MTKIIDLTFYTHRKEKDPFKVLELHKASTAFVNFIPEYLHYEFVKHADFNGSIDKEGVKFTFFRSKNHFWFIPYHTLFYIRRSRPQLVLIQGFIFPLQLICLKLMASNCKIIQQHHGENPFRNPVKRFFQKLADRFTDGYLFTCTGNNIKWLNYNVIRNERKCMEVQEAAPAMEILNREMCKQKLGLKGEHNFLWVGRLNKNKDPLTALRSFSAYIRQNTSAKLYMIFHTEELKSEIQEYLASEVTLGGSVILCGRKEHAEMKYWYNAADYYISASHQEAMGYATMEAMTVGCIPVLSDIPPFRKITQCGKYGFLFKAGDPSSLLRVLMELSTIEKQIYSNKVKNHIQARFSPKKIAEELSDVCLSICK